MNSLHIYITIKKFGMSKSFPLNELINFLKEIKFY